MSRTSPLALVLLIAAGSAAASPSGVVISGFQVRGPVGGNDEYVEIRNTSAANVDNAFCTVLSNFAREADRLVARGVITPSQGSALADAANRIRAVQGCH